MSVHAQIAGPGSYPVPTPGSVDVNVVSKDPMYLSFKSSVETTYGVKCGDLKESLVRTYIVEKFKAECPLDEKSGVNIVLNVHDGDARNYIKAFKVKPYGKIKSQF